MSAQTAGEKFQRLVDLMARLRAPGGCPWDREQTFDTIKPYLLEETYEVMDAIDARDWQELAGELGDLLLQAVFFSQMAVRGEPVPHRRRARCHQRRSWSAAIRTSSATRPRSTEGDVRKHLERNQGRGEARTRASRKPTLLGSVPRTLPALVEAQQIASRAAQAGFDWENAEQVLEKLHEELARVRRRAPQRLRAKSWKTSSATCSSCW